jgi:cytochrome c oxidase cbb3-type subunit 3
MEKIMAKVEDRILDHNYDGIQEYDNPLPRWWVYLFILTVIWGVVYFLFFHVAFLGQNQQQEYLAEFKQTGNQAELIAQKMKQMWANIAYIELKEPNDIESGKAIFQKNCISCHGANGEGGIGPNLTDKFWIHGGGIQNVMTIIINGVPEKGMITWKPLLKPEEVQKVASFVLTLQGTNPANGKVPQGDEWKQ